MGRSKSSLRSARQRPWRVRPASPGRRRVQRTCDSIRTGPMPVRTSIATRVPGGSRVGSSIATPPPLMSVVRPRHAWGVRLARREHRTGRLITKRTCLRATRVADGDRTGGREADPFERSVIASFPCGLTHAFGSARRRGALSSRRSEIRPRRPGDARSVACLQIKVKASCSLCRKDLDGLARHI
jgi:hypothetical protein